jgi:nicotinamidase-related amidase
LVKLEHPTGAANRRAAATRADAGLEVCMSRTCLVVIDVQHGFVNDHTAAVPARVESLQHDFDRVFVTRFYNAEGSPWRRLIHWHRMERDSAEFGLAFSPRPDATVIDKPAYTCVTPAFLRTLSAEGIERVHLAGIATDNCVLKTAVDLFEAGLEPRIHTDACASHGGDEAHRCGLMILGRMIGRDQLL